MDSDKKTEKIISGLAEMGISLHKTAKLEDIRSDDDVFVYRVKTSCESMIVKYFEDIKYAREINNYAVLSKLNIQTPLVFGSSERCIVLEDIETSGEYRLAAPEDLADTEIAKAIGAWYRNLHKKGREYIESRSKNGFFREIDVLTQEEITVLREKSGFENAPVWALLLENLHKIRAAIESFPETLTYNDFYWTNMIVDKDKTSAFMFDYDMMGAGYAYGDVRNVCGQLGSDAAAAFISSYGFIDENEKALDDVVSVLTGLILAFQKPVFPGWGNDLLKRLKDSRFENAVHIFIERWRL